MVDESNQSERRQAARVPLSLTVALEAGQSPTRVYHSHDLSSDGAFLYTTDLLEIGTEVKLSVELPEKEPLRIDGVVVRTQMVKAPSEPRELSGIGVRFGAMSDHDTGRLGRLVDSVREALLAD